jgi:hypothetical protein
MFINCYELWLYISANIIHYQVNFFFILNYKYRI